MKTRNAACMLLLLTVTLGILFSGTACSTSDDEETPTTSMNVEEDKAVEEEIESPTPISPETQETQGALDDLDSGAEDNDVTQPTISLTPKAEEPTLTPTPTPIATPSPSPTPPQPVLPVSTINLRQSLNIDTNASYGGIDANHLYVSDSEQKRIEVYDKETLEIESIIAMPSFTNGGPSLSTDGEWLYLAYRNSNQCEALTIWDTSNLQATPLTLEADRNLGTPFIAVVRDRDIIYSLTKVNSRIGESGLPLGTEGIMVWNVQTQQQIGFFPFEIPATSEVEGGTFTLTIIPGYMPVGGINTDDLLWDVGPSLFTYCSPGGLWRFDKTSKTSTFISLWGDLWPRSFVSTSDRLYVTLADRLVYQEADRRVMVIDQDGNILDTDPWNGKILQDSSALTAVNDDYMYITILGQSWNNSIFSILAYNRENPKHQDGKIAFGKDIIPVPADAANITWPRQNQGADVDGISMYVTVPGIKYQSLEPIAFMQQEGASVIAVLEIISN